MPRIVKGKKEGLMDRGKYPVSSGFCSPGKKKSFLFQETEFIQLEAPIKLF